MKGTIGITGGTGFVGRHLQDLLLKAGYDLVVFSRSTNNQLKRRGVRYAHWDPQAGQCDLSFFPDLTAVVHLAGAGVADKRWTKKRKREILDSRVIGTSFLIAQLRDHAPACKTLVTASAIGYYGPDRANGSQPFLETDAPHHDFLGNTCVAWEQASEPANAWLRRIVLRIGIVFGKDGGALKEFEKPQHYGVVPILGSGQQIISWIHVTDLCRLILWTLETEAAVGIYNAVSPNPLPHREVMRSIARSLGGFKIPAPVPAFFLEILLGEMAVEVLKSCRVSSDKVVESGFSFQFASLNDALNDLI